MRLSVDIIGKAAHAGIEPEKGISSIKGAAYAISMLKEGWIDQETTVNIGIISGGEVLNAVPERTNVKIECRSQSNEKCLDQSNLIKEVFLTAGKAIGARVDVKMKLGTKAFRVSENSQIVKVAKEAISFIGLEPRILTSCGGSDATSYNEKNVETIVIGTGAKAVHTKEEHIAVKDMEKAIAIIRYICEELTHGTNT
jgi:tripeptide aminopeptidase